MLGLHQTYKAGKIKVFYLITLHLLIKQFALWMVIVVVLMFFTIQPSKKYILWVNAGSPGYQIYTSDSPYSGFTAVAGRALIGFQPAGTSGGDFTIENINGTGYLVYSSIDFKTVGASIWPPFNQTLFVQELTPDFMTTTGAAYHVLTKGDYVDYEAESPDLFYRNGYYYITASDTCGFCTALNATYTLPFSIHYWTLEATNSKRRHLRRTDYRSDTHHG